MDATLEGAPEAMLTALGFHEAFRRFGVAADDIFVSLDADRQMRVIVGLCAFQCGELEMSFEEFASRWAAVAGAWNTTETSDRDAVWTRFVVHIDFVRLVPALRSAIATMPERQKVGGEG